MPKPDERVIKANDIADEKRELQDKIELAQLDVQLKSIRSRMRASKKPGATGKSWATPKHESIGRERTSFVSRILTIA